MTAPFGLLREALRRLALDPEQRRQTLAGAVVTDELALDLDNAVRSLPAPSERSGISLDDRLLSELRELNDLFDTPASDPMWDDASLDSHPAWVQARHQARRLLSQLPSPGGQEAGGGLR